MTLEQAYEQFTPASAGFVRAVQDSGGIDASANEIKRIAARAGTPSEFVRIWEGEEWWTDKAYETKRNVSHETLV